MTWLTALIGVAVLVAIAAVTGIKPKGTRHVARTGMMSMARIALLIMIAIVAYLIYRAQSGG
jgi:Mg2+/citrate symporter